MFNYCLIKKNKSKFIIIKNKFIIKFHNLIKNKYLFIN